MICPCHKKPMYWQKDARQRAGGRWECREKRRAYNGHRIRVCNESIYIPDKETREFALHLREERKEKRGRPEAT